MRQAEAHRIADALTALVQPRVERDDRRDAVARICAALTEADVGWGFEPGTRGFQEERFVWVYRRAPGAVEAAR